MPTKIKTSPSGSLHSDFQNLQKVLSVNSKLNSTLDLDALLGIIMNTAAEVMNAKAASLMLFNETRTELIFKVAMGCKAASMLKENFSVKLGEGIAGTVAKTGKSVVIENVEKDKRFAKRFDQATGFSSKAIICVPLKSKTEIIGVLEAINPIARDSFCGNDIKLFEAFANQAAIAVENARMHAELLQQEKSKQELKIAHEIQQNFLPDLTQNKFDLDIAAKNIPAREVGGDFYDIIRFDGDKIGIIIGDVSGKGVPAALYMVRAISEYRFLANRTKSPSELLFALNNSLAKESQMGMFITLLYMVIDSKKKILQYASAGHHPILLRKSQTGQILSLENQGGLPVGLVEESSYDESTVFLETGDSLFAYTDGIIEARNVQGKEYSLENLKQSILKLGPSALKYTERILEDLKKFTAGAPQHDDITALTIVIPA